MSVLIKGMEIPKNCLECMFRISYWKRALTSSGKIFTYGCMLKGKEINTLEERFKDCPIDGIPTPHGRLIDGGKLIEFITNGLNRKENPMGFDAIEILTEIEYAPTIIEAEA